MAPWANGETGRVGSPKRREIGHGALAARALLPVLPSQEEFSYTLRLVAEVLASNGSTSMASVCSGSLALMDAGVPIKAAVAGIAMGLVYAEGKYTTLTDILGAEDAFGDMDFKVAGTSDVITALQLDTKIEGIPADVLAAALDQAKEARTEILANMNACIAEPRAEVAATAPKIISITIPMDKIGEVIGPKGKVINTIQQETGADIAVDDDGSVGIVTIGAVEASKMEEAKARILAIVDPPKADVGATYMGRVVNVTKFGAFVNILPGRDGLVHISKLGKGKRINNVEDVLTLGQEIEVIVEEIDEKGKVSLTPGASWNPFPNGDALRRRHLRQLPHRSTRRLRQAIVRLRSASMTPSMPSSPASSATSAPVARPVAAHPTAVIAARVATTPAAVARVGIVDPAPGPDRRSRRAMTDLRISQLESGLTVATEHVPGALSVATGVWVGVGSRDEPAELSGVSHFLEHLLFKGTPTRTSQEISRSVDRVGGDFNAFTSKEYTAYYIRLPARHAVFGVDLLGDVLIRPALRETDVDSERLVILEELAMDDDSPDDVAHRAFAAQLFADHPLGRETAGDRQTVQAISAADVRRLLRGSLPRRFDGRQLRRADRPRRGVAHRLDVVRRRQRAPSAAVARRAGSRSVDTTRSRTTPNRSTS